MEKNSLQQLLTSLSDGQVHSGESLGARLGISRAAVWKQIKAARQAGLPLRANRGEGYQLEKGFEMLRPDVIKQSCTFDTLNALSGIDVLMSIDSTNSQVMRLFQKGCNRPVVLAEKQTAGRGRRGRVWHSPFASSIYLTVGWIYAEGISAIEGLSLVVGLKVVEALQSFGATELQLKWPNDIYWRQRKLAGILIDVQNNPAGVCQVAIGVGINVNLQETQSTLIDQPWVDLGQILQADDGPVEGLSVISRNKLAAELLNHLIPALLTLPEKGFSAYQREWQRYDACYGKPVTLQSGTSVIAGRACGVNSQGAYGIDINDPKIVSQSGPATIHYVSGGEISLRINTADSGNHE